VPGAPYRYRRQQQTGGGLALVLVAGTLPGVVAGSIIRVELLPGPKLFDLVIAAALLPIGAWLGLTRPVTGAKTARPGRTIPVPAPIALSAVVGCVCGIYGIGGGSILAPILIGTGRPAPEVAPAALASTFVTSVAGVVTFTILSVHQHGPAAWTGPPVSRSVPVAWRARTSVPASRPGSARP
jgi:uncharacterized membrane protein YfcA